MVTVKSRADPRMARTSSRGLPRTLDDLARFPMAFRRVMLNAVTLDVRVRLWREHLEVFLGAESALNELQQQLVVATIPRLPELFATPTPNSAIVQSERQLAAAFSPQQAARVFTVIGPPEPPEGIPLPPDALR
jgi:hypothetical protein